MWSFSLVFTWEPQPKISVLILLLLLLLPSNKIDRYVYNKTGTYRIVLESDSVCKRTSEREITVIKLFSTVLDSLVSCDGIIYLNPSADSSFKYEWSPSEGLDDPNIPNPKTTLGSNKKPE